MLVGLLLSLSCLQDPLLKVDETERLNDSVNRLIAEFDGDVGIYAKNLKSGWTYALHADDLFATASVFKVPVMIELFRRAEAGELRLDQRRKLPSRGISRHGTGFLKHLADEPELTLHDYCRLMICISDNMATDTLMQITEPASITATMRKFGFPRTRVSGNLTVMHYKMAGIDSTVGSAVLDELARKRFLAGQYVVAGLADRTPTGNVTTPREMGALFEKLHKGEIVSRSASAQMMAILKQTADDSMIPQHLPAETEVAHKSGGTWRVRADAGVVYLSKAPVVVSIFAYHDPTEKNAREIIAKLAKRIVEAAVSP